MRYTLIFVIDKKGNVLLLNRKNNPAMGTWCGVGGHIEKGETVTECARRELFEETGISGSKNIKIIGAYKKIKSYIFTLIVEDLYKTTKNLNLSDEGILFVKNINWVLNPNNIGVTNETKKCIKYILDKIIKE